jgi:hypothetical protein
MPNPYELLGVSKDASAAEIKRAYRRLVTEFHPDLNKHDPNAASRYAEVNAAYEILGDKDKRVSFDRGEIDAEGRSRSYDVLDHEFTEVDDDKRSFGGIPSRSASGTPPPRTPTEGQRRNLGWIGFICLVGVAGGALFYFRGSDQLARSLSRTETACATSSWQTRVTLDNSRPELVSTTLRSRNHISSHEEKGCVDMAFACRAAGPYFEVRVEPGGPQINEKGAIILEGFGDELNASVSGSRSDDGKSIRISDKVAVEVLATLLMDRDSFAVRLNLSNGVDGVAHFESVDLPSAIRPVVLACRMRFFRSVREDVDPRDFDYGPEPYGHAR